MKDEKSLFTRIIEGEIPSFKIFENEYVYSFLDINPASYGHTLVVPKEPASSLHELSQQSASELGKALAKISKSILEVTGVTSYNIVQITALRQVKRFFTFISISYQNILTRTTN